MSKIIYVLPHKNYFSKGAGGALTHALGILNGLRANNVDVELLTWNATEEIREKYGLDSFISQNHKHIFSRSSLILCYLNLIRHMNSDSESVYIVRKKMDFLLFYFLFGRQRKSLVWEVNGLSSERFDSSQILFPFKLLMIFLNKFLMRLKGGSIYAISDRLASILCTGIFRMPTDKVFVVPNGGPEPINHCQKIEFTCQSEFRLVFFGKFQYYNDYSLVLQATAKLLGEMPNLRVFFVGFGEFEATIDSLIDDFNLRDKVSLEGPTNLHDFYTNYVKGKIAIGIIPMRDLESLKYTSPIKLYEYASLGLPCIASDNSVLEVNDCDNFVFRYTAGDITSYLGCVKRVYNLTKSLGYTEISSNAFLFSQNNSWKKRMEFLSEKVFND